MWAVTVRGLAKANDGASASNNAMEMFSLISILLLHSYIGRAERYPGFKFR